MEVQLAEGVAVSHSRSSRHLGRYNSRLTLPTRLAERLESLDESSPPFWTRICFCVRPHIESDEEWQLEMKKTGRYCTVQSPTSDNIHSFKIEGYKRLKRIATQLEAQRLQKLDIELLMWSALGLLSHFKLRQRGVGFMDCIRKRDYENANYLCALIITKLLPEMQRPVVESILTYISEYRLWSLEFLALGMLRKPLTLGVPGHVMMNLTLNWVDHMVDCSAIESRQVVRILYGLMENYNWPAQSPEGFQAISRLLKLFYLATGDHSNPYALLRKGLEVCALRILQHMDKSDVLSVMPQMMQWIFDPKLTDNAVLDIGNVLEHAAMVHSTGDYTYTDIISDNLFISMLNMVASKRRVISHVGNRLLHQILDRHENRYQFETPKIFFQDTHFNVRIGENNHKDMVFLQQHRELFHNSLLKSMLRHADHRLNLESTYTTICILACEVPCCFTAAAMVCLAINIQESVRHYTNIQPEVMYHVHATVIAIVSLICWVYKAQELYEYTNKVLTSRAEQAPHLNPPLRNQYTFAQHHIAYEKPELFFEDWEVRYGLWKCFKIKETRVHTLSVNPDHEEFRHSNHLGQTLMIEDSASAAAQIMITTPANDVNTDSKTE